MGTISRVARSMALLRSRNPLVRAGDRVLSAVTWVVVAVDHAGATAKNSAAGDGVVVVLTGLQRTVCAVLTGRARRSWERQWLDIEPRWTGRKGREPA